MALDGKVVEHQRGYRGARATVVALAAVERMRIETSADPDRITELFSSGAIRPRGATHADREELYRIIVSYLTERERSHAPWTSANKSES